MNEQKSFGFVPTSTPLSIQTAMAKLHGLVGHDLRPLADAYGIKVGTHKRKNKGWAGQTVEAFLGQSPNSDRGADFGDWELKVVPLLLTSDDRFRVKESMAIGMFRPEELESEAFAQSHLAEKMSSMVIVARHFDPDGENCSIVVQVAQFELEKSPLREAIKEDYEEIRWVLRNEGIDALGGHLGTWIQPRVKGGSNNAQRGFAFYARSQFVANVLGLA